MSQLLSIGLPGDAEATTLRSGNSRTGEAAARPARRSALENGAKVQSAPSPRWRDTHSQSLTTMSTRPACSAVWVAWEVANCTGSSAMPAAVSKPCRRMTSTSHDTVPRRSNPTRTTGGVAAPK